MADANADANLKALEYHRELRDYLKASERELWNWFSSARAKENYAENLRLELLKTTYRLDLISHGALYESAVAAAAKLGITAPVTLYQAQNNPHPNAAIYFLPEEAHIVFSGPTLTLLAGDEVLSVLAHELAHHRLWTCEEGDFHIADRMMQAAANDLRASGSHRQSARRFQLYTELFADRASLLVTGNVEAVVRGLLKVQTGLAQVSAESYLAQAEEIFRNGHVATEGVSHPEGFIRARSLRLWKEKGDAAAPEIRRMIEGEAALDALDLIGQRRLAEATRGAVGYLLWPKWFQTPAILGHARQFFPDFAPTTERVLPEASAFQDAKLREYLSYVLIDFAMVDPDLDEAPLAAALELAKALGMDDDFAKVAAKEMKIKAREMKRLRQEAAEILKKAEAQHA
jgi:hypothetical protein